MALKVYKKVLKSVGLRYLGYLDYRDQHLFTPMISNYMGELVSFRGVLGFYFEFSRDNISSNLF